MTIKNGDLPAMPLANGADGTPWTARDLGNPEQVIGLTKREEFVRSFIQGLLSNSGGPIQSSMISGFDFCNTDIQGVVNLAVEIADCALEAMERTK